MELTLAIWFLILTRQAFFDVSSFFRFHPARESFFSLWEAGLRMFTSESGGNSFSMEARPTFLPSPSSSSFPLLFGLIRNPYPTLGRTIVFVECSVEL